MKIGDRVRSVLPFHSEFLVPTHKRILVPTQISLPGFYPSVNKRRVIVGAFYEGVDRGFYGGELNDVKFDIEFLNGKHSGGVKLDIVDTKNNLEREIKGSHYNKEAKITHDQLRGIASKQYRYPEVGFSVSFYRYNLPGLEKIDRTGEEIMKGLLENTLYSLILPLNVVLKIKEYPKREINFGRNHIQREGTKYESCLCIAPSALHRFLTNPHENLGLLGFDSDRFKIERYLSPQDIRVNKRKLRSFPIVRITDQHYGEWVKEFMIEYEREMEQLSEDIGLDSLPIFDQELQHSETPFD